MIVQVYNETTGVFDEVTDEFQPLELDVEIDITSGHTVEYSGVSVEVSGNNYTFQNGQYILFRDGSNMIYSGYISNLKLDTKRNIFQFDIKPEIDRLRSHRVPAILDGLTIQDKLDAALNQIQTFLVHEQFDQYTLPSVPTGSWWEAGISPTRWETSNAIDGHMMTPISLYTNNSGDDNTDMLMRFADVVNGTVIVEFAFYMAIGGGNAQSFQIKIGNGSIAADNYAAYITFDGSDFLTLNGSTTGPVFQRGRWQVIRIELDVDLQLFDTYFNDVLVDNAREFNDSLSYLDMVYFNCQWNGISGSPANFYVDSIKVGSKSYNDKYSIVAMDSIAASKLDLDDSDFPGLDDLYYLGDSIQGSNGKNYHCVAEHQSEIFNQPVTGNAYQNYWDNLYEFTVSGITISPEIGLHYSNNSVTFMVVDKRLSGGSGKLYLARIAGTNNPNATGTLTLVGSGGGDASISFSSNVEVPGSGSWEENKQYGRNTFNNLLVDMLRLMNGHANQHYVICNVVNHQIRFYGFSETWTPSGLVPNYVKEFIEDQTGEQFVKFMDADELRGSGSINHPNNYQLKCWKWEHELEYAAILEFLDFHVYNGIRGLVTSMSIRKSIHEYVLTEIQNLGIL